jgi:NAD(P)H-flavin reductase
VLARRSAYRGVVLIAGARTPDEFLFRAELDDWSARDDLDVELAIDSPAAGWDGTIGFVTEPLARLRLDPGRTVAFLCGPEPMMRFSARVLLRGQVPADRIHVSLERSMKCGIALCGHCQLGPTLVCRDGPVYRASEVAHLLTVREL